MRQIYVNLPVKDVQRSRRFFTELGFAVDERFSNDDAICVELGENAYAMMLGESFFSRFIDNEIPDPTRHTGVITALSAESREEVDRLLEDALTAGGSRHEWRDPVEAEGMLGGAFKDPDGNVWEALHMEIG